MEIITATDKHVPEIMEIWKEYVDFHKDFDPRFPIRKEAALNWEKYLRELMKVEDNQIVVASDKGHVVGFSIATIRKYPPTIFERETDGFISDMAVKTSYRRTGIGESMLGKIMEWFKSRQIDRIVLSVSAGNQVGYPFWKKHGFKDYVHYLYLDLE